MIAFEVHTFNSINLFLSLEWIRRRLSVAHNIWIEFWISCECLCSSLKSSQMANEKVVLLFAKILVKNIIDFVIDIYTNGKLTA